MDQAKVEAAKAWLGEAWVLHPRYQPEQHPAHRARGAYVLQQYFAQRGRPLQ